MIKCRFLSKSDNCLTMSFFNVFFSFFPFLMYLSIYQFVYVLWRLSIG